MHNQHDSFDSYDRPSLIGNYPPIKGDGVGGIDARDRKCHKSEPSETPEQRIYRRRAATFVAPSAEVIDTIAWARQLLGLAQECAGRGVITIEEALLKLTDQRDAAFAQMDRWKKEARRLGSTMEAWVPESGAPTPHVDHTKECCCHD